MTKFNSLVFSSTSLTGIKKLMCVFLLALFCKQADGQVSGYTAVRSTSTYVNLSGATATCNTAATCNGQVPVAVTLPWNFNFNGTNHSTIYVNENGFITFGSTSTNANTTPISNNTDGSGGVISVFGFNNSTSAPARIVQYKNNGTSFSIEWINAGSGGSLAGTHLDAMITLFQTTNVITFAYRAPSSYPINSTLNAQVGLRGVTNADFKNLSTLTAAPGYGTLNTTTAAFTTSNYTTVNNTLFTWTPPSFCTAPTTLASAMNFSSLTTSSVQVNWTNGNGASRVVVAHATTAVSAGPATGTDYAAGANSVFGSGTNLGSNNYVVYAGTGSSVNVTGLTGGSTYFFSVYEASATFCYSAGLSGSQAIPACLSYPSTNATSMVYSNITNNALTLSFTRGNGSNVMVVARLTATTQVLPTFNNSYTANTVFGSGSTTGTGNFVVLNGTANTVTVTGLANSTAYTFDVYEYNTSPNCYSPSALSSGITTLDGTTSGGCSATVVRTTGTSAYTAIAPATVITSGGQITGYYQGGAINTPGSGLPIGFNFVYNGITYTTFGLGVNGYIWFGSGVPSPTATYPIADASANLGGSGTINGIVCAAGVQLNTQSYFNSGRSIGYTLSGSAPNRVLTIQWKGYALGPGGTACSDFGSIDGNRLDFQIILNEDGGTNSNKIGIAYQNMSPYCVSETGASTIAQIGLRGANNTDFSNRGGTMNFGGTDWGANAGAVNTASYNIGLSGNYIATNSLMTFTQAVTTGPTVNGFSSGGSASNSCPAITVPLTAGAGFTSYQWFFNGSIIPGPGSSSSTYTATASGSYSVVGKNGTCYLQSNPFTVTINSCGIAPSFTTCPGNQFANTSGACNAVVSYTTAASGTPTPTLSYSFSGATTGTGSGDGSGSTFNVGTTAVTVTATNGFSPDATCTFNVVVTDNENPSITCPANVSVNADAGLCSANPSLGTPTTSDNCGVASTSASPAGPYPVGTTNVVWTVTDVNGNTNTCTQMVTVIDNQAPSITCPANVSVNADAGLCSANPSLGTPTTSDNCGVASTSASPAGPYPVGTTNVVWTVTDVNGNTNTCTQMVTVIDNQAPSITCPANVSVNADAGLCSANPSLGTPTTSDNCGVASTSASPAGPYPVGTTNVVWTVTDVNGNTNTCTQTVTVIDNQAPSITCPADVVSCNPNPSLGTPTTSDNCAVASTSYAPAGPYTVGATTVVTWTVTDVNGNTNTCMQNVTISTPSTAPTSISSDDLLNDLEICSGDAINLTQVGGSLGTGASYAWYTASCGGASAGSGNSINVSPSSTTTYYVRAIGTCNTTACASVTITVKTSGPGGAVQNVVVPASGCTGNTVSVSVPVIANTTYYNWSGPAGTTFNGIASPARLTTSAPTVVLGAPLSSGWSICVQGENACGVTTNTKCSFIRGTISQPGAISGSAIACANTSGSYTIAAVAGADLYEWTMTGNATVSGTGTTGSVTFGPGFTGGTLCVRAKLNCGTASTYRCITISSSTAQPAAITGSSTACPSSSSVYSIPAVAGATSYNWTVSCAGGSASGTGTSATITFPASYSSCVVCVTANSSCGVPSASRCKTVTNGTLGTLSSISGNLNGVCASSQNYSCPSVAGATGYTWSIGGGIGNVSLGQGSNTITVNWNGSGTSGTLSVVASNGCGNSAPRTVNIRLVPGVNTGITGDASVACNDVGNYAVGVAAGATGYNWSVLPAGPFVIPSGNTALIDFNAQPSGNYTVYATSFNGCGNGNTQTFAVNHASCARVAHDLATGSQLEVSAYPNPAHSLVTVNFNSSNDNNYTVKLVDLSSRVVYNTIGKSLKGNNVIDIDLSSLAKGVYMLQLNNGSEQSMIRLIVE